MEQPQTDSCRRRAYRRYRRTHKRYRKPRFDNRASSRRKGRLAPSIKRKKDAIVRVVDRLRKWIRIHEYHLEDVAIDIRAMTDGYKPFGNSSPGYRIVHVPERHDGDRLCHRCIS